MFIFCLVCKPHPGNEIVGWSFLREPGKKELRCFELFRLQNHHSISQSVHKFCLNQGIELLRCFYPF